MTHHTQGFQGQFTFIMEPTFSLCKNCPVSALETSSPPKSEGAWTSHLDKHPELNLSFFFFSRYYLFLSPSSVLVSPLSLVENIACVLLTRGPCMSFGDSSTLSLGKCFSPTPWVLKRRISTQPPYAWPQVSHMSKQASQNSPKVFIFFLGEKELSFSWNLPVRYEVSLSSYCRLFLVSSDLLCFCLCDRRADIYTLMVIFLGWQEVYLLGRMPLALPRKQIISIKQRISISENFRILVFPFQNTVIFLALEKVWKLKLKFYDRFLIPQLLWLRQKQTSI